MKKNVIVFLLCFCSGLASYAVPGDARPVGVFAGSKNAGKPAELALQTGDMEEIAPVKPFNLQFAPGLGIVGFDPGATNYVLFGMLGGIGHNLQGFGLGGLGLNNTGFVRGAQVSGIYNTVSRDMTGLELAGIFNLTEGEARGVQIAGIFNNAEGPMTGVQLAGILNLAQGSFQGFQIGLVNYEGGGDGLSAQIGIVNVSENENVIPLGLVNIVKNGLIHPAIWHDDLGFTNLSLRTGSKYFYSILGTGVHNDILLNKGRIFIVRSGVGVEIPFDKVFVDFDVSAGQIFSDWPWDSDGSSFITQVRLSAGYKLFEHLGIFAGISYDYIRSSHASSPRLGKDFGFSTLAHSDGRNTHKLGFFAGFQF
jgi:hypothetical protein